MRREATKPIVNLSVLLNIQVTWLYNGDAMVKLAIIMFGGTIANCKMPNKFSSNIKYMASQQNPSTVSLYKILRASAQVMLMPNSSSILTQAIQKFLSI